MTPPRRASLAALAGIAGLAAILALPDAAAGQASGSLPAFELGAAVLALCLLGGAGHRAARLAIAALATLLLALKLLDRGTSAAFGRPFDPLDDWSLLPKAAHLLAGTLGPVGAGLAILVVFAALLALPVLLHRCLGGFSRIGGRLRAGTATAALLAMALAFALPGDAGRASNAELVAARVALVRAAAEDRRVFARALEDDPTREAAPRFEALAGHDVVVLFVESYGTAILRDAGHGAIVRDRLAALARRLGHAGYVLRSGAMTAPVAGGQSWLARASVFSGLTIDRQSRYETLIASGRPSLNRLMAEAGWESVAVMPAITRDWPEAAWSGYDRILAAGELGYRGRPFDWVTMPDQFTLAAFQRLVRMQPPGDRRPVMAEIALISSHAPFTPLARLVPEEALGDGSVFDAMAREGPAPAELWRDTERVRDHYARSLDYTLSAIGDFVLRHGDDTLFVILGDHPPAPVVTGPGLFRDVPVHVIARDAGLVDRFAALGWVEGPLPDASRPALAMADFRQTFARLFSAR
ncbi:sulfatase-like hydrolase/transferase [Aurantimonas sp. Leaf443]|uniref:sulfatase-like hydrolase/transferase n=1 Tax=Aurantimonas sp. Leaf443 TaxID=1736378 RepID=UPI0006F9C23C|nr:sulfatase-like hydrolase/transferase [Aurantimonas sp. Leaf443]KQT85150.1 hypothetical protein ASG48_07690 [Aurantimonas sp. Leaf443]